MAVFETSRALNTGVRTSNIFTSIFAALMAWNDRRVTRKALSGLSARELEDIGLSRGDIANF